MSEKPKVTVFTCFPPDRHGNRVPRCSSYGGKCPHPAINACEHELDGEKAGQTCSRPICASHTSTIGGKKRCPPHTKLVPKEAGP